MDLILTMLCTENYVKSFGGITCGETKDFH